MKRLTKAWVRKAENDWAAARKSSRGKPALHDDVCFHGQQCAEKYLKALLEEAGLTVPRTHNLDDLLGLLRPHHPTLHRLRRGLIFLNDFAVGIRYPEKTARKRQAEAASRWAGRVREAARTLLGIRARRRRKRSP